MTYRAAWLVSHWAQEKSKSLLCCVLSVLNSVPTFPAVAISEAKQAEEKLMCESQTPLDWWNLDLGLNNKAMGRDSFPLRNQLTADTELRWEKV